MIKRCLALHHNFLSQYKLFCERFTYHRVHLKEYLQQEMDRVKELYGMHDKFKQNAICEMSSHLDDHESN